ncbi:hypothetical protein SIPHO067v1_p0032 [Vibrio phage 51E28.1]|nr:hypothetical protein SIPHO068v1_p0069 [Vibrio phage 51E28.4]QZI92872.1 hypothetical protein SIPHO067v1_p0032 [Vibrio phage 51E28.1]
MEHIIEVKRDGQKATVSCSCGLLYAQTIDRQVHDLDAVEVANLIGQSHLTEMKAQVLIKEGDYVIMPKEPSANTIVLMAYDYPTASVSDIKESYITTIKQGKCLTNILKTDNS